MGLATSSDGGKTWSKSLSNPVFSAGAALWEGSDVWDTYVLWDEGASLYKMWYTAGPVGGPHQIGYAISSDGISWTRESANPALSPDAGWESGFINSAFVLNLTGTYYMFYGNWEIGSGI
ncbi:MAG: hypothetical protein ACE5IO_06920, partial [Thermoplasmata archaeon]